MVGQVTAAGHRTFGDLDPQKSETHKKEKSNAPATGVTTAQADEEDNSPAPPPNIRYLGKHLDIVI